MSSHGDSIEDSAFDRIVAACDRYEEDWRAGLTPSIEAVLDGAAAAEREELFSHLIAIDIELRRTRGERPVIEDYVKRFPDRADVIASALRDDRSEWTTVRGLPGVGPPCEVGELRLGTEIAEAGGSTDEVEESPALPERLGRYIPTAVLGFGGFATVYLARDDELGRQVAIKVPHAEVLASRGRLESLLREARLAAGLRHPGIVRVLDISPPGEDALFVVLDYVTGRTLSEFMHAGKLDPRRLVEILISVCEAAHYAHQAGLVHRDLKPSNILIDSHGRPFVTDFGLAIHEDVQPLWSGEIAGTPRFMAPEQVRGETHRLDGRTDIWAVGVILYAGICGRMPFQSRTREGIFDEILNRDPRPAREVCVEAPRELERIALKCLAKRMTDRYTTAADLADDLQLWLHQSATTATLPPQPRSAARAEPEVRVVPKGLRSFDLEDADFFLSLLPGPRDRDGLPESIRSWKARIEAWDPERSLPVGLLYGASGCGKSSLVKAGLLPRLAGHVKPVYVEASSDGIEARLLAALRRRFPYLPANRGLAETAAALREGTPELKEAKVLIVLDQFEQWLHDHVDDSSSELVQAIRQCDGRRLQALILVRDDFWMGITRFLRAVETPLVEGVNSAAVELFDGEHARRVLIELGRAHGKLDCQTAPIGTEAGQFLDRAIAELAGPGGWIVPVRLSLFAEMVKHRPWTPATLKELGGIEGIGVTFLEETFAASSAPPAHRAHRRAALAVLEALLPEPSSDLKGKLQGSRALQKAAEYDGRDREFTELMGILDHELRMVTPVDVEGLIADGREPPQAPRQTQYQLTHDYLVPPLRQWLTRKHGETFRGRARLCLLDRTALWTNKREAKQLPSWREWVSILLATRRAAWTRPQRLLMREASQHHLIRSALAMALCAIVAGSLVLASRRVHERSVAQEVRALSSSDWRYLPALLDRMDPDLEIWRNKVEEIALGENVDVDQRTRAALALARHGPEHLDFLTDRLLDANAAERSVLRAELSRWGQRQAPKLWDVLLDESQSGTRRLAAASALAAFDPTSDRWHLVADAVVRELTKQNPLLASDWVDALRPVRNYLRQPLFGRSVAPPTDDVPQIPPSSILAEYAETDSQYLTDALLAQLLETASAQQFAVLLPLPLKRGEALVAWMMECLAERVPLSDRLEDERQVERLANAAETLLVLGHADEFWRRLKQSADPRLRTRLIDRLRAPRLAADELLDALGREDEGSIRQAIVIGLGSGYPTLPEADRARVAAQLKSMYHDDPDPGVHGAAEWVLAKWGYEDELRDAKHKLARLPRDVKKGWFITPHLHTMIVVKTPGRFVVGSPDSETNRDKNETQHEVSIDYSFAISAHEVTFAQFRSFERDAYRDNAVTPSEECPKSFVSWSAGASYCNWLTDEVGMSEHERCYLATPGERAPYRVADDFLMRPGYRLPTDHEWEYVARADAATSRFFGNADSDLDRYAWFALNSQGRTWPVGQLRPNPLGLFDIYGNVDEWCEFSPQRLIPDGGPVRGAGFRAIFGSSLGTVFVDQTAPLRGGGFRATSKFLRSAMPRVVERESQYSFYGFRIAMTLLKP
jgi:serine/threonine protein kinase/formylglycine-generating enzyme required for sulfatase activity